MRVTHLLIASEANSYRPWILKPAAWLTFCVMIWGIRLLLPTAFILAQSGIDNVDLMNRINQERINRFIPALITNSLLNTAANGKSADMLARGYFAHVDPDGNYVWPKIEAAGYTPYLTLGENLAMDFHSAAAVVEAWMNSPTHRANIVNDKFQDQGLAAIYGEFEPGHDTVMITNLFGALLKQNPPPSPRPPIEDGQGEARPDEIGAATPAPSPPPAASPLPTVEKTEPEPTVSINPDIKISRKIIGNEQMLEIDVIITGAPERIEATIKNKSTPLLPSAIAGQYLGVISFSTNEDLDAELLRISAGSASAEIPLRGLAAGNVEIPNNPIGTLPATSESQFLKILKLVFAILAGLYAVFLGVDSVIIYRAKIKRANIPSSPHLLLFILIVAVSWFSL